MAGKVYSPDNLPNGMIGLDTTLGQERLARTSIVNDLMVERFFNQLNRTFCGPASLALLFNALNVAYRIKYIEAHEDKNSEDEFFKQAETGHFRVTEDDIVNLDDVKEYLKSNTSISTRGLNIQNMEHIVNIIGFGVNVYLACGNSICESDKMKKDINAVVSNKERIFNNVEEFKNFASDYIKRPVTGVIVNYNMQALGYEGLRGHFSPLAAYDQDSDSFLLMDVWPDTPPAWVKSESLFNAMSTIDNDSNLPRGLLHIHELIM